MNVTKTTLIAFVIAAMPPVALAQTAAAPADTKSTPRIDQRQANQEKRIEKGVESGKLNDKEAARMQKGQERVQKMENKAAADGKVTKKERAHIEHAQDHQSKRIYGQKHDKQTSRQ